MCAVRARCLAEVLQQVPFNHVRPRLGEHFVPVLEFHWPALRAEHQLPDRFVAPDAVVVHDADDEARLPDALVRHREDDRLFVHRVQSLLFYRSLLLLHLLAVV